MTIVANYWLIFPVILLSAVMFLMRKIYMATSQSVKRMEAVCKYQIASIIYVGIDKNNTSEFFRQKSRIYAFERDPSRCNDN